MISCPPARRLSLSLSPQPQPAAARAGAGAARIARDGRPAARDGRERARKEVARLLAVRAAEDGLGEDEQEDVGVADALAHALEGEQRLPHVQPVVQPELRVREEERADLPPARVSRVSRGAG